MSFGTVAASGQSAIDSHVTDIKRDRQESVCELGGTATTCHCGKAFAKRLACSGCLQVVRDHPTDRHPQFRITQVPPPGFKSPRSQPALQILRPASGAFPCASR